MCFCLDIGAHLVGEFVDVFGWGPRDPGQNPAVSADINDGYCHGSPAAVFKWVVQKIARYARHSFLCGLSS